MSTLHATTYKLTQVTSVEAGGLYVFEQAGHVMNNTVNSSALQTTATYSTTGLTGTETYVWTLEAVTGGYYLKNVSLASSPYLNNSSSTTVSFGIKSSIWTIAFTDGVALISNTSNSNRFLGYTDATSYAYKAYATSNLSSYSHAVTVYKLEEEVSKTTGTISVSPTTKSDLTVGGNFTITPSSNNTVDATYRWESSNSSVASVSNGVVTGVAEGSATITATLVEGANYTGGATATCSVTVVDGRTSIGTITAISPSAIYVGAEGTFTLTQSMVADVASYTWESSDDEGLVVIDGDYLASAEGDYTVTVTANPSNTAIYKPVTAPLAVSVSYKYTAPIITKSSGDGNNFTTSTDVTIGAVSGATVYYTTDGSTPTNSSTAYSASFPITATTTIKAIAIDGDGLVSPVSTATYTKEAVVYANIALAAGKTLTFNDFSGAGSYANGKSFDVPASDGDKYTWTGNQFMNNTGLLQMKAKTGTFNSGTITSPNGFKLTLKYDNANLASSVKNGSTTLTGTETGTNERTYSVSATSATINISANSSYATYIKEITFTANKAINTISTTTAYTIDRTNDEEDLTLSATSTSGAVTYSLKSSSLDPEDYDFDAETGYLLVSGTTSGTIVITVSSAETDTYLAADDVDITVTVAGEKTDATFSLSDDNTTYGTNYVADCSSFACGAIISVNSSNTAVATAGYAGQVVTVTPVAVGTSTITVNTAESSLYKSGTKSFVITVESPVGCSTVQKAATTSTATLDFSDNTYWELPTSSYGTTKSYSDGNYTITLAGSSYYWLAGNSDLLLGEKNATLTFQEFDKFVTQIDVNGNGGGSGSVTQNIFVGETAVSTETSSAKVPHSYVINEAYQAPGNVYTLKVTNANNTQISSIVLHFTDVKSESVTFNSSGYTTLCSQYPLDFSDYATADYSAWEVTDVDSSTGVITFSQITGSVKGGTAILLMGEAGETVTLTSTDSENTLSTNKLVGTLAPTYIAADEYYGLSGNEFVKVNAGTVPAGKALLPVDALDVKAFSLEFYNATGIVEMSNRPALAEKDGASNGENETMRSEVFDLSGRRVMKPTKGLYIVNGKKIVK